MKDRRPWKAIIRIPLLPDSGGREAYLEGHPTDTIIFDWKSLLGTPAGQKPARDFAYKHARETEQWKECGEELKLRLKENLQAKIAPVTKAYDLLNGKETEGYAHLEECVRHNSDYMKERLKEFPNACNDNGKNRSENFRLTFSLRCDRLITTI